MSLPVAIANPQALTSALQVLFQAFAAYKKIADSNQARQDELNAQTQRYIAKINAQRDIIMHLIDQESKTKRATLKQLFKSLNKSLEAGNVDSSKEILDKIDKVSRQSVIASAANIMNQIKSNEKNKTIYLR